jgi:hypothetical protein
MNLPTALLTIRWMVRDTFRQSLASRLFWVMLGVSVLCVLFCLSVRISGDEALPTREYETPMRLNPQIARQMGRDNAFPFGLAGSGLAVEAAADPLGKKLARAEGLDVFQTELTLGFGAFKVLTARDRTDAVRWLQVWLSGAVADTVGIFLVLIWTAGFLPTFLDPNQVTVLLAKPVPRWSLLVGKYVGVLLFVALQASVFVLGTWLALGISTGVFDGLYLLTIPLLVVHFGIFYSFSVLLAVWTRNTVVCVFGSLLFWVVCWGMNYARVSVVGRNLEGMTPVSRGMLEAGYWMLPKPGDMSLILYDALKAEGFTMKVPEFKALQDQGKFHPELSVLASIAFALAMLAIAAREFQTMDY